MTKQHMFLTNKIIINQDQMWKAVSNLMKGKAKQIKPIMIKVRHSRGTQQQLVCKEGENLMDVTNKSVNQNTNVYGLCDKQLACTTCSVQIEHLYNKLPRASEEELDILYNLPTYKDKCTRMACQIIIKQELDGMVVRIPHKSIISSG